MEFTQKVEDRIFQPNQGLEGFFHFRSKLRVGASRNCKLLTLAKWVFPNWTGTVDGWNPAPPGMYKPLQIMG